MEPITFTVRGIPVPQGSTRAFIPKGWSRPIITAANKKTKPWRQQVSGMAYDAMLMLDRKIIKRDRAVLVECYFYFAKPKSTKKSVIFKVTKPDIDKLLRSILDALTGVVFEDDSQVTRVRMSKGFGECPRVEVKVEVL